jgi:hypothetical protein
MCHPTVLHFLSSTCPILSQCHVICVGLGFGFGPRAISLYLLHYFLTLSDCVPGLVVLSDRLKIHFPVRIEHDYILVSSKGKTKILSRQHALVGIFERIQVPHWTYWK